MCRTSRVARRTSVAALGFLALLAFFLPGPTSALVRQAAPEASAQLPVADPGPLTPRPVLGRTSVAFGGGVHLTASISTSVDWVRRVVEVTRISADGEVLDPLGIEVVDGWGVQNPVVTFDGTNFLVTWATDSGLAARRVSPAGEVLDASDIQITTRVAWGRSAVTFDGANHLVVWVSPSAGEGSPAHIYARRVSPGGTVVDPADLTISTAPGNRTGLALASDGTRSLLVWSEAGVIRGTVVDRSGVPQNPSGEPFSSGGNDHSPAVTATGTSFLVAWTGGWVEGIRATPVSAAGVPADPDGIPITTGQQQEIRPTLASNGTTVLVTWLQDYTGEQRARYARLDPTSGAVLDPGGRPLPALWDGLGVASDGTDYLVADAGVAVRLAPSGDIIEPGRIVFAGTGNAHAEPDTAFDGTNSFVVWSDDRHGDDRIFGSRVGADGASLDGAGISISAPADLLDSPELRHESPAVAFDGTNYLVVWSSYRYPAGGSERPLAEVGAARVSPSGEVLGRFVIAGPGSFVDQPEVAFGDGVFLVVWEDAIPGSPEGNIEAARVSSDGVVLDRLPSLNGTDGYVASDPAVAYGTSGFQVVWQEWTSIDAETDVRGVRVAADGTVEGPVRVLSDAPGSQSVPDVAFQDGTYLVVWEDGRNGFGQIFGTRVDASGAVLDPSGVPIATHPDGQGKPSVAANGLFFVAWTGRGDIAGTTVSAAGAVGAPQPLANSSEPEDDPVVSPVAGSENFAVAYERFDTPHGADQTYLTHVSPK